MKLATGSGKEDDFLLNRRGQQQYKQWHVSVFTGSLKWLCLQNHHKLKLDKEGGEEEENKPLKFRFFKKNYSYLKKKSCKINSSVKNSGFSRDICYFDFWLMPVYDTIKNRKKEKTKMQCKWERFGGYFSEYAVSGKKTSIFSEQWSYCILFQVSWRIGSLMKSRLFPLDGTLLDGLPTDAQALATFNDYLIRYLKRIMRLC